KRRLTVVTCISGSGKSSHVFGAIAAAERRLVNETYSSVVQAVMPPTARPDVDHLDGLTAAIVIDQERMGSNPGSTVGTATDALAWLRVIFSRLSTPHVGPSTAFSFNTASASGQGAITVEKGKGTPTKEVRRFQLLGGMCPDCEGMGTVAAIDEDVVVDRSR